MENYLSLNFDEILKNIDDLKYLPWVGKNFEEKKILIVVESVYNWAKTDEEKQMAEKALNENDFARKVVEEHGLFHLCSWGGHSTSKIGRSIERTLSGKKELSKEEREFFWKSIAFHEFVQTPMSHIKERPNIFDFKKGAKILQEIINVLRPHLCVFFGSAYNKVREIEYVYNSKADWYKPINRTPPKILNFKIEEEKSCKIIFIKHYARYFI